MEIADQFEKDAALFLSDLRKNGFYPDQVVYRYRWAYKFGLIFIARHIISEIDPEFNVCLVKVAFERNGEKVLLENKCYLLGDSVEVKNWGWKIKRLSVSQGKRLPERRGP